LPALAPKTKVLGGCQPLNPSAIRNPTFLSVLLRWCPRSHHLCSVYCSSSSRAAVGWPQIYVCRTAFQLTDSGTQHTCILP